MSNTDTITVHLLPNRPLADIIAATRAVARVRGRYNPGLHSDSSASVAAKLRQAESSREPLFLVNIDPENADHIISELEEHGDVLFAWDGKPLEDEPEASPYGVEHYQTALVLMRAAKGDQLAALMLAQSLGNVSPDPQFYVHVIGVLVEAFPADYAGEQ